MKPSTTRTNHALERVREKRAEQDRRWGLNEYDGPTWLTIIAEEFGKVAKLVETIRFWRPEYGPQSEEHKLRTDLQNQLFDLAGVSVAYAEVLAGDTPERPLEILDKLRLRERMQLLQTLGAPVKVDAALQNFELTLTTGDVFIVPEAQAFNDRSVLLLIGWITFAAMRHQRIIETTLVDKHTWRATPILNPSTSAHREEYLASEMIDYLPAQLDALENIYLYMKGGLPALEVRNKAGR